MGFERVLDAFQAGGRTWCVAPLCVLSLRYVPIQHTHTRSNYVVCGAVALNEIMRHVLTKWLGTAVA